MRPLVSSSRINLTFGSLVILLASMTISSCADEKPERPEFTAKVKTYEVGKKSTGQSRRISGKIKASEKSSLSFGVGGRVIEIIAKKGEVVTKGQLLAKIDPEPFQLQINSARAEVKSARASLIEAESDLKRIEKLVAGGAAAAKVLVKAKASLVAAQSEVDTAKAKLESAEFEFGRTDLTAPFSGKIVDVPIDLSVDVAANDEAVVMQADGRLKVEVRVPESLIRNVSYGQAVRVGFSSLGQVSVHGQVLFIGAEAESGNAFPVTVLLDDSPEDLRAGMTATVTFTFNEYLKEKSAFLVPLSAIAIDVGLRLRAEQEASDAVATKEVPVFVLDEKSGTIVVRTIKVGDLRGNEIEVFEGLVEGDHVVSAGVPLLREGMKADRWVARGESKE